MSLTQDAVLGICKFGEGDAACPFLVHDGRFICARTDPGFVEYCERLEERGTLQGNCQGVTS